MRSSPVRTAEPKARFGLVRSLYDFDLEAFAVEFDDPGAEDVQELLAAHFTYADQHSPIEYVHVLDLDRLLAPDISFFSIREDGRLLGVSLFGDLCAVILVQREQRARLSSVLRTRPHALSFQVARLATVRMRVHAAI